MKVHARSAIQPKSNAREKNALTGTILALGLWLSAVAEIPLRAAEHRALPKFDRVVVDSNLPGGYQVEVADVNGDGRPDIVGLGGGTCAWYENPSWKKRIVSTPKETPRIISSATADLDGDGKAEIAIAYEFEMNQPKLGQLALASQNGGDAWTITPITSLGSIHRLRWGDVDGDGQRDLVVAPIFGPKALPPLFEQDQAHIVYFRTGSDPKAGKWSAVPIGERPVLHAIEVRKAQGGDLILTADNLGVACFRRDAQGFSFKNLIQGAPGSAPKKGSSEVHLGKLNDGRTFLATIDPWHGQDVSVSVSVTPSTEGHETEGPFAARTVIDDSIKEGHALWVADVDGDGDDEVFAGYRGPGTSVLAYDFNGKEWTRTVLDPAIAAQDLRGGDIDGDGTPDVVAIGGSTHNVVWYRPRKQ